MRAKLCSAVAAVCAVAFAAVPALADPALWVVKSDTSTVYLFGTVHAVNPSQAWRTPAIDRAFHEASELWLEVPLQVTPTGSAQPFAPEEQQRITQLMATQGMITDGPPLTSRLTPAEVAELTAYTPVPKEVLDRMRPWMAATAVTAGFMQKLGLSPASGADISLDQQAVTEGKPVHGFETTEQQIHFFADLTPDEELGYLRQGLADVEEGKTLLEAMERDWLAGDDQALTRLAVGRLREKSPLFYRRFDVDRNKLWGSQIEAMLKTPGVRFVAVGVVHLLGPDGVPELLRKDDWRVERVQ
jgi:uncharacterized protein YbaP (TraB family)